MRRSENMEMYINDSFRKAVLRREEIKPAYIVFDHMMHNVGMDQYIEIAKNRILDMEGVEYLLEHEHMDYDLLGGLMHLDEVAFISCSRIIKGYVEENYYQSCLSLLRAQNDYIRVSNNMIKSYRNNSLHEVLKEYIKHKRMKPTDERHKTVIQVVLVCHRLELISRIPLVRLYYKIYYWSCKTSAKAIYGIISRKIKVNHIIESGKRGK